MSHPFELDPAELEAMELDFEEQLTEEETAQVGGGRRPEIVCISAPCPGSEGGGDEPDYPWPKPLPYPWYKPYPEPPEATTLALGEEGGGPLPYPMDTIFY
jgi:hypothetical protein